MDSDLSLIEISGEDDSFLLQPIPIPNEASASVALDKNYFPCSPLQSLVGSSPSVSSGGVDKENIGVESLQRKRKNKKGGYNLRKSLAWNRAFLTEEGVLDPVELSMISGNGRNVMSDKLAVIHEDDKDLSHENAASHRDSGSLPALEQKLPRVVGTRGQSAARSSINTRSTTAKPTRIPVPSVKRRVLAAQDVNSSRSKHNSSSSVTVSSSLKRTASSNTTNIGSKDLKKVSKARTANPDLGLHLHSSAANTTSSSGYSKQTQRVKPYIPAGRNVRMKKPLGNASGPQRNATRSIPAGKPTTAKSTTQQASENMLANPQSRLNTLNVKNMSKPPVQPFSRNEVGSASSGVSLVENPELSEVKIQHQHVQKTEPTGLRMPSPSFSFFAQTKASASPRSIINVKSLNALPPVSSNMKTPHKIGSADIMMLAPAHKMMPTPDMKSESNAKGINSNVKTSVGCIAIPRQGGDTNEVCDTLNSFQQVDVGESPNHSKFSSLHKEACEDLREDMNNLVSDVHKEDENASGLSSPCRSMDIVIPARWCECEDEDPDGRRKTGRLLDSEDGINRGSTNSLKVEMGLAFFSDNHCLIDIDAVTEDSSEQLKDFSSNSEQPFNLASPTEDIFKESTGHIIAPGLAPASTDGGVTSGPINFIARSQMNSDEPGTPWLGEDQRTTSLSMASGDGVLNGKGKVENAILEASDCLDSIRTTTHEEPIDTVSDVPLSSVPTISVLMDVSTNNIGTLESITDAPLSLERAEDNHVTLTCFPLASLLQPTSGSADSNQTASLAQVDSSHDVGVHSDSGDMITTSSYLESQLERVFDELYTSASAENANGDVAVTVAIDVGVKTESEKKIEMLDSLATYDSFSCEMNILNAPKCVTSNKHSFVSAEYEVLDCSHQLGNQQASSPIGMLADKASNEESLIVTELNGENDSSSLVSNVEMNDDHILVALGVASLQEPETAIHGSANRIESPVSEDTRDDLAKCLSIDSPSQPHVGRAFYNQSSSPVREESPCHIVASPSVSGNKIVVSSNVESQSSSPPVNIEAHISSASNVQQETESCTMTRDFNDTTLPPDGLDKDQKQDDVVVKPPVDAVPYSDEWLAAMEAAGEDILKMKSGAVQNSPPERSEPELGPWSPVRRKNNQAIGPFDCTKFINPNVSTNSP